MELRRCEDLLERGLARLEIFLEVAKPAE